MMSVECRLDANSSLQLSLCWWRSLHNVIRNKERSMLSCDYNGWADVPEEEREAIDAFEAALEVRSTAVRVFAIEAPSGEVSQAFDRLAA
jgi:hypothetical protein